MAEMLRVNQILTHPLFQRQLKQIEQLERERIFCRHGMEHLLSVARLAYLYSLEEKLDIPKELIYAAALLHDIGRGEQYLHDIPHDQASAELAEPILKDCGFSAQERTEILTAISSHRAAETGEKQDLCGILYQADKKSRPCFACPAAKECNWTPEKRNSTLQG
jgi:putative nucleotidyltransferase with HDIG domain